MNHENILKIILAPHMSEKAAVSMEKNGEYVFNVVKKATKEQVKNAIEMLFKTKVKQVNILNVKGKPKRFGQIEGYSKPWKKAYVTLQSGHRIDFAGSQ